MLRSEAALNKLAKRECKGLYRPNHSPKREIMGQRVTRVVRHETKMLRSVLYLQRPVSALQQASGWCGHSHSVPYSHLLTHGMTGATVRRPRCCAAKRLSTSLRREKAKAFLAFEVLPDPTEHRRESPTSSQISRTVREATIRNIGYLPVDSLDQCKMDR